jgi:hypothetical protein
MHELKVFFRFARSCPASLHWCKCAHHDSAAQELHSRHQHRRTHGILANLSKRSWKLQPCPIQHPGYGSLCSLASNMAGMPSLRTLRLPRTAPLFQHPFEPRYAPALCACTRIFDLWVKQTSLTSCRQSSRDCRLAYPKTLGQSCIWTMPWVWQVQNGPCRARIALLQV